MSARNTTSMLAVGAAVLIAGGAGYGVARLTAPSPAPAPAEPQAAPADTLEVPASHLAVMQIAVEPVAVGNLSAEVRAPGSVTLAPSGEAVVTAQASGAVTRLDKRLGDQVRAGEVVARVASRDAAAMVADQRRAEARLAQARQALAREQQLFDQRVTPRQDLERVQADLAAAEAEAARARTAAQTAHASRDGRSLLVVSPIAGRITSQSVALGAFVQPESELFRVADPRFIQVEAAVLAPEAARIRPGDPARVTGDAGAEVAATVRSVTPTLDPQSRTATVLLSLDGGGSVTPGEAVQVRISPRAAAATGVVIPEAAVQTIEGRDVVFLRTRTGFKAQPVVVSARSGGRAAVASGLSPGQAIATRNAFLLKAELTKTSEDE